MKWLETPQQDYFCNAPNPLYSMSKEVFSRIVGLLRIWIAVGGLLTGTHSYLSAQKLSSPSMLTGEVTYVSAKHVYLRFDSTQNLHIGDTVYIRLEEELTPALIIVNKSSISTVCDLLPGQKVTKKQVVFARKFSPRPSRSAERAPEHDIPTAPQVIPPPSADSIASRDQPKREKRTSNFKGRPRIRGRLSAASYSSIYTSRMRHRLRYTFSLRGDNIQHKPLSFDIYTSLRQPVYSKADSNRTRLQFRDMLRIYRMGMIYNTPKWSISGGRIIDRRVSNIGAIDGLLVGRKLGRWELGAVAGLRPDFRDYSLNPGRIQFGGYLGHSQGKRGQGYGQSILGVFEQRQHNRTDRRFLYFQHSGTLAPRVALYGSMEVDVYKRMRGIAANAFSLTNVFVNLNYRLSRKFSISTGYDNRRQILYYETYRDYVDSLLERETRQGIRLRAQYRPFRRLSISAMGNIRVGGDLSPISKYYNLYVGYSRIPGLNMRVSASAGYLENVYLSSLFYTFRASKPLYRNKMYWQLSYRASQGKYLNQELRLARQNISTGLDWQVTSKWSTSFYYEYITSGQSHYQQVNMRITRRF